MKPRLRKFRNNEAGFVLVESVLSWTILAIIALAFVTLFSFGLECLMRVAARKEALSNARFAVNRIVQELLPLQADSLISISPQRIVFRDGSGVETDFHAQSASGTMHLYRGDDLLAKNLASFAFFYFDGGGAPLTDFSRVEDLRRIQLNLAVKDLYSNGKVSVKGEVYPRNFYYSNFQ